MRNRDKPAAPTIPAVGEAHMRIGGETKRERAAREIL